MDSGLGGFWTLNNEQVTRLDRVVYLLSSTLRDGQLLQQVHEQYKGQTMKGLSNEIYMLVLLVRRGRL
jgi:hypothetical protein